MDSNEIETRILALLAAKPALTLSDIDDELNYEIPRFEIAKALDNMRTKRQIREDYETSTFSLRSDR